MLRHINHFIGANNHSSVSNFFINLGWWVPVNFLTQSVFKRYLPDLTIQAKSSKGTDGVFSTVFHEMGHASHFEKVGSEYWAKYVSYIITYGYASGTTYGDGTGKNVEYCALGEMWGYHIGDFLTIEEFGATNEIKNKNIFERFIPHTRPYVPEFSNHDWIPKGIMNDIMDSDDTNTNQSGINFEIIRTGFEDRVSGYTTKNIFNALDSDINSPQAFRDRLLQENSNRDKVDLLNLFEAYYWN